jgi:hypothetical protein
MRQMIVLRRLLLVLVLLSSLLALTAAGQAQTTQAANTQVAAPATTVQTDPQAASTADKAVREWLAGSFKPAQRTDPRTVDEATARTLEQQFLVNSAPRGANVNLNLRALQESQANRVTFKYPLSSDLGDASLLVTVIRSGQDWSVRSIRYAPEVSLIPREIFTNLGGWLFVALTALLAYAVLGQTRWRRWMLESWAVTRTFFGVYVGTNIALYGLFALGSLVGAALPLTVNVLREIVSGALSTGGLEGLRDSSVPSAAFAITLNNLRAGILFTSFIPGSFFAIPAYLIALWMFPFYGIALSPVGLPPAAFALHIPTIIIEMQSYIYIIAASGIMLTRIIRSRMSFGAAWRDYAKALPVAITILVVAAWYEAFEILVLFPLFLR